MAAEDGVEIPKRYKAAVYDDPGKISTKIETLDTPEPGPGEVLLKLDEDRPGTFQQYVVSQADYVTPIPDSLKSEDAALASHGMAMRVIGIDHGSKEKLVRDCGAEHFIDVTKHDDKSIAEEVVKTAGGLGASAVIV
ncbi:MAG: hypothetical protein LQ338_002869 [Usnochroma carphineum]|nr:MAG: hypothetical protein LQ338_002869 [Usnochroma carphineum]